MNEVKWIIVLDKRVTAVEASGTCGVGDVKCVFIDKPCFVNIPGEGRMSACNHHASASRMFITEDQLPAYLAGQLTANT